MGIAGLLRISCGNGDECCGDGATCCGITAGMESSVCGNTAVTNCFIHVTSQEMLPRKYSVDGLLFIHGLL